ncbi:hypothetical protein SALBM311S_09370 [Streptomyces alboniger]
MLLGARLKAEAAGGGVHLAGMLPVVSRVFEITGADAVFTVHDTLEAALAGESGEADESGSAAGPGLVDASLVPLRPALSGRHAFRVEIRGCSPGSVGQETSVPAVRGRPGVPTE